MGQGPSGPQGLQGEKGAKGDTGLAGSPGKDATVNLKEVTDSIIVNKTFQNQLVPLVSKDNTLTTSVSKEVANDTTFSNTIVNSMATDTRFKGPPGKDSDPQQVATLLGADDTFSNKLAPFVAKDSGLINTVGQQLVQNTTFSNSILGTMASDPRFKGPKGTDSTPQDVANTLSKDTTFTNTVSQKVAGDTTFSNTLINSIAADSRFKGPKGKDADINISTNNMPLLTQNLVSSDAFLANLAPYIANNNQLGQTIATNLASSVVPRTLITNSLTQNENYRKTLVEAMAADTRFRGQQGIPGSALDANSLRLAVEPRSLWCADGQMCKTPTNSPGTIITGDLVIGDKTNNNIKTPGNLKIGSWTLSEDAFGNLVFNTTKQGAGIQLPGGWTAKTGTDYILQRHNTTDNTIMNSDDGLTPTLRMNGKDNADAFFGGSLSVGNDLGVKKNLEAGGHIMTGAGEVGFGHYAGNNDGVFKIKRVPNDLTGNLVVQRADGANNWKSKIHVDGNGLWINGWNLHGGPDFILSKTSNTSNGKTPQFRLNGGGNDDAFLSGSLSQNKTG